MIRIARIISRLFVGLVFIFSGFVKGVDPLGTAYKIEDYFIAFGTDWAIPFALPLAVLLCVAEFSLGVFLVFNIFKKTTAWLVALMMILFTFLTLNDAIYNPVPDCGCFGDFIILTNWETFYKNLVIDFFLIFIFFTRNSFDNVYKKTTEWSIAILIVIGFTLFNSYNINRLPLLDFRSWKVGTNLKVENPKPLEYYLIYKNKNTGETEEYLSPNYPYNDSIWMSQWEYSDMRVVDPNERVSDIRFFDLAGQDITDNIVDDPMYHFLLISYDLNEGDWEHLEQMKELKRRATENAYSFSLITASSEEIIDQFQKEKRFYSDLYQSDDIDLKTIIRSNPGLVVLKNGVIMGKWAQGHLPQYEEIIKLK
ncbi:MULTISPECIES: BT_3928 family protein [unclassified Lentimicrobium]|uniref:BT_3928 family protein n=1 Tax=unclassified Lentimicrobium TaxID=2677434 RepID=UPI0015572C1E|nr:MULTISPECIES: BT_3928 family protein [unclassified Lentimicrobium]NPD44415.1 DoxX family protein [Lentimicrobium sp. S6]NPD84319.1 DoxX family protein [Lentimicrobium sp. L6]